ncbi:MAG: FG-GAP repeat protein [Planctomycetaceae bacterium]|nr:FG-GAP repeat protein [Planctomycetaceae bacterium]
MNNAIKLVYAVVIICICTSAVFAGYAWLPKKINASDGVLGDSFGCAVAVSGDWAVVGAYADESSKGAAYVYRRVSGAWTQQQKLTASDGAAGDCFGISVAINGDYIIVGANKANSNKGAAYIFHKNTSSVWGQHKRVKVSDGLSGDLFGQSVTIYGNWAAVGAEGDNGKKGSIYIFTVSDTTSETESSRLVSSTQAASARFGCSVSMYGTRMIVGAYTENSRGAAYFFGQSSGIWQSSSYRVEAYDAATSDNFGCSVAICGDYAVVGASNGNVGSGAGTESGSAYIYRYKFTGWECPAELTPLNGLAGDMFGRSVSINGNSILIGAPGNDNGAAYMYSVGNWTSSQKITAAYSSTDDFFGGSVCTDGTYMMCGDVNDDDFGINSGSAYIFEYTELGTLTLLTPNGGENLSGGSAYDITWNSTGPIESVTLDYSVDNAGTWTTIGTVVDTGSYEWTVADANSSQCRLRVRDAGVSGAADASNNVFRIYPCKLNFDLNSDCIVDFLDFADLASEWLKCGDPKDANCVQ